LPFESWSNLAMDRRAFDVIHLLLLGVRDGQVCFFLYPHPTWSGRPGGDPLLSLPTKKTVPDPNASVLNGQPLESFVDAIMGQDLQVADEHYALEQELPPATVELCSPSHGELTTYTVYPLVVWVDAAVQEPLRARVQGYWLTCAEALRHPQLSPTARCVLEQVLEREAALEKRYREDPDAEHLPLAPRRLLAAAPAHPSMDALARKWRVRNRHGVSFLDRHTLDKILAVAPRAFNLRVADPYLPHQRQGIGFTWSFFTHKDPQDVHVHGAPVVEVYGVLEGRLELWWKAYNDRGTSAWSHRVLGPGDWAEVEALHCHIVHWLGEGKGVVFKAGPGPLAEVGRLGVKGKTSCAGCGCMKPPAVCELERLAAR
jgi:hypothetical protein